MNQKPQTLASQRILDVAEELAQRRGFNGFSYADIAEKLLVTKASLHYHFASKAELGRALIVRYRSNFEAALRGIAQRSAEPADQLRLYATLYGDVLVDDRLCLCGMFAAEFSTLPEAMQEELKVFFDSNERWLAAVLEAGRKADTMHFRESPKDRARLILGSLEGAMLVARTYADTKRFRSMAKSVLADLTSGSASS